MRAEVERAATSLDEQSRVLQTELGISSWTAQAADAKADYDKLKADVQQQGVNDPSEYGRLAQEKTMRDEVCQVMEGGKEAFERRYQRLGREV